MGITFKKAARQAAKARICILGPSGAGKTFTSLELARGLVGQAGRIAVIDSESKSASLYAGALTDFDVLELSRTDAERDADRRAHKGGLFLEYDYDPRRYIEAIEAAGAAGYDAIVVDSLTHAWDGVKAIVDASAKKNSGNSWAGWADATPLHKLLIDTMLRSPSHILTTMRVKTEWATERDERTGKVKPVKIGLQPEQRGGMEYEFGLVGEMNLEHVFTISKTRYMGLGLDQAIIANPGRELGARIAEWLAGGVPVVESSPAAAAVAPIADPIERARAHINSKFAGSETDRTFLLDRLDEVERGEMAMDELRSLFRDMIASAPPSDEPAPTDEDAPAEEPAATETPADEFADLEAAIAAVPDKDARRGLHIAMGNLRKGRTTREAVERQIAEATPAASTSSEQPAAGAPEKTPAERAEALRGKVKTYPMARTLEKTYLRFVDLWERGETDAAKRSPAHDRLGDAMRACLRATKPWQGPRDGSWNPAGLTQDAAFRTVADEHVLPFHLALILAEYHFGWSEADRHLASWATETDADVIPWLEWVESLAVSDQAAALRMTPQRWLEQRQSEVA